MSAIDTPDYQRGTVSAQVLLAELAPGVSAVTVGLPVNVETLVILAAYASTPPTGVVVQGATTGIYYPAFPAVPNSADDDYATWFVDVTSVLDSQVNILVDPAPSGGIWVYADTSAHVTFDTSKLTSDVGMQYVVPSVPSTLLSDHPPYEMQVVGGIISSSQTVVAAPGEGHRIRVYTMNIASSASGLVGYFEDEISGESLMMLAGPATAVMTLPGQGYPLETNAALNWVVAAGSGIAYLTAYYTIDTV